MGYISIVMVIASLLSLPLVERLLKRMNLAKENYQKEIIPTGFGLYLFFHLLVLLALFREEIGTYFFFVVVALGGLFDDLYGNSAYKGLRGHMRYFIENRELDTALLKILLTTIGATYLLLPFNSFFISDLLLLLLSTNTINLLDLRPGRAMKGFLVIALPLLLFGLLPAPFLYFFIPFFFYLPKDLRGETMLGDTGSNLLGSLLGFLLLGLSPMLRLLSLFLFVLLHSVTERYSLSRIISQNPILRSLDRLGRGDD